MSTFRVIMQNKDDILIQAENFRHRPDEDCVIFVRKDVNVAIFTLSNIVGFALVNENGYQ